MEKKQPVQAAKKKKKGVKPVFKPYDRGAVYGLYALKRSGKVLLIYMAYMLFFLLVGSSLSFNNVFLNVVVNLVAIAATVAMMHMEGLRNGDLDVSVGEIVHLRRENGKDVDPEDLNRSYHPLRSVLTPLIGVAPLLLIAIFHAVAAKPQYYTLGVLPGWVSAINAEEVSLPLQYYDRESTMAFVDVVRIIVRLSMMPYIHIVSTDNIMGLLWLDRLSPVLMLLPAAGYMVGYLRGPQSRALTHGSIAANTRRHKRKQQRERKARQAETKQLI